MNNWLPDRRIQFNIPFSSTFSASQETLAETLKYQEPAWRHDAGCTCKSPSQIVSVRIQSRHKSEHRPARRDRFIILNSLRIDNR